MKEDTFDEFEKEETIKNKIYRLSDELARRAQRIIDEKNLEERLGPSRIKYLLVSPNITERTAGRCILATNHLKFFSEADYIIEISADLYENLNELTRDVLLYHELLHVSPVYKERSDSWTFKLADHDVQDFRLILEEYSLNWLNDLQNTFAETYDIDPQDMDGLRL